MENIRKLNKFLILLFILLQPELDMIRQLFGANFEIFGFSLLELINILLIGLIFIFTIITYPKKEKLLKWIWLIIPYILYFIIHYYNITKFNNSVFPEQYVSIVTEFYYLFRVFILPLVLVFCIYYSGIKKKELFQIFELFIVFVSASIIILNITNTSYLTYDTGRFAIYNIFDWFNYNGDNFQKIATKGWFSSGNQISAIMLMSFPLTLYLAYNNKKIYNYVILVLQLLAMLMLGTKVANMGCILVLVFFFIIILFKKIIMKKEIKSLKVILIITILMCTLFIYSPRGYDYRYKETEDISGANMISLIAPDDMNRIKTMNCESLTSDDKLFLEVFSFFNQNKLRFPDYFLMSYPITYNHEFWCYMTKSGINFKNKPIDYREMKTAMLKQIYIYNHNSLDKYVGMGYTLNFIYTEEDYTYQFYSYGVLGIILFIGPYLIIFVYLLYLFFRKFKDNFKVFNVMLLLGFAFGLVIPILSGHVFERSFPLYILAFITGINILNKDFLKEGSKDEKSND